MGIWGHVGVYGGMYGVMEARMGVSGMYRVKNYSRVSGYVVNIIGCVVNLLYL